MFQQTATNTAMHKQTDKPPLRKRPVHLQTYDKSPGRHSNDIRSSDSKIQRKRTPHNEKIKYFSLRITLTNSFKSHIYANIIKYLQIRKDIKAETICNFSNC